MKYTVHYFHVSSVPLVFSLVTNMQ